MAVFGKCFLALFLALLLPQGAVQDRVRALYYEALAAAPTVGLPGLVRRLDAIANETPSSPFFPDLLETIHAIGLLHPGSVPDLPARLKALTERGAGNPGLAKVLRRIEILRAYYQAAVHGQADSAAATLSDPVFEGSLLGVQAQADAALRARDYRRAESLARQVLEADPYSPLLANAHMILGLGASFQGDAGAATRHFRHALAVTELPTIYGDTRNFLFTSYRFSLPSPAPVGAIFDEVVPVRLEGFTGLKDPQSLALSAGEFILVDKEQIVRITPAGKVVEARAARKIVDVANTGEGRLYSLTEDGIDLGSGSFVPLSVSTAGKPRSLRRLRSLAVDDRGDVYLLDQDAGLLRGHADDGGNLALTVLSPVRGGLVRIGARGDLFVLDAAGKGIQIFSREGSQISGVVPAPVSGKEGTIQSFALDLLDHLYVLDSNSIQIFAIKSEGAGPGYQPVSTIPLEPRPPYKNLRVLGITMTGEMVTTGKNEDTWIYIR